jgi:hypothetical protein
LLLSPLAPLSDSPHPPKEDAEEDEMEAVLMLKRRRKVKLKTSHGKYYGSGISK